MRNFWKRANRGLILGGVLVLGTCTYVGIDYFRFSHGKDDMEQVLRSYTADLAQAAITPTSQAVYEYQKTDAEREAYYQTLGDVIRNYWTDTHDSDANYYYFKSDMLMSMHTIAYETNLLEMPGYITGYTTNISQIKLTKNGPGAAKFSMNADMVVDTYGSCWFPTLSSYENSYYDPKENEDDDGYTSVTEDDITLWVNSDDEKEETDDELTYYEGSLRTTGSLTYYGELIYEDGTWKISWMDCYWSDGLYPIHTEPQEGGN